MDEKIFSGNWRDLQPKVKKKWEKLTNDDIANINGERKRMLDMLEERYGWENERAEEELKKFEQQYYKNNDISKQESFTDYRKKKEKLSKAKSEIEDSDEGNPKKRKII